MRSLEFLQRLQARHGDVFRLRLVGRSPLLVVGAPELAREVFQAPADVLDAGEGNRRVLGWLYGEHSLILLEGERHMRHRRMLLPPLHGERLARQRKAMRTLAERHLGAWKPEGESETLPDLRALALDVIAQVVLGEVEDGAGAGPLREALVELLAAGRELRGDDAAPRDAVREVESLLGAAAARRRGDPRLGERDDVLSLLLQTRNDDGSPLEDAEIAGELLTLIVAGSDTTAGALSWALERLARAPEAQARAAAAAADGDDAYLDAVVFETLRMRPVVPMSARLVKRPFDLGESTIPPGTLLAVSALLIHHRADLYPEPLSFRPERFLGEPPGTYTWIPFGGGVRRCVGAGFALQEMRVVLSALLARMALRPAGPEPEGALTRANTLVPAGGGRVRLEARRPAAPPGPALPPGSELPPLRQAARWLADPVEFMRSLQRRHGDVFTVRLPGEEPWVMVGHPELVKQVFTAPREALGAGDQKRILRPIVGPMSVMLTDGEAHMRARRLLLPPFHAKRIAGYEATMRAVAEQEIVRWPAGVTAPAAPRLATIALEVILRTVFGLDDDGRRASMREAIERLVESATATGSGRVAYARGGEESGRPTLRALVGRVDELLLATIAERRDAAGEGGEDVLSLLLQARYEDGSPISDAELRDQLMTLLIAGHETVATSLAWGLERLVRTPRALGRTVAEAPDGGGPYTDAVVRETLRVRPVILAVPRLTRRPFRLGDHEIPAGVSLTPSIPLVHLRPELYPDPEAFRPERFLEKPPGTYTWIPFGGGTRRCIGAGFSLLEMRAVLSTLLARAKVRVGENSAAEPPARRLVVTAPARGAELELELR